MSTALSVQSEISFQQIERMAQAVAKSNMFGVKTPEQALALMLLAQAEGMHPAIAARDYHVIQGRPALKADTMLARFQQAGGKVEWTEYTDARVCGKFSHAQAGTVEIDWTMERAKAAGLIGKDVWKQYPRAMLRARCISEGVRTCYPGVAVGTYTVEEAQDMEVVLPAESTAAKTVQRTDVSTALTETETGEHLSAIKAAGSLNALTTAFSSAWTHAKNANDKPKADTFKLAYDEQKKKLEAA